jgi:aubergine-like protein
MVALLLLAVEAYFTRNSSAPKEILIFVNGTPGDQVCTYNEQFSLPLTSKLREIYTDNEIFTTMVMVSCKCSERFFSAEGNDQVRNVQAGTLISEDLVSLNYDFYIVSQQSNRGTAVPNNYKVVFSNSKMEEGVIQEVAFAQCFNYVNWTGSIKVPAILQYAKKCSTFNSEVMEKKFVPSSLQTRLYFV